MKNKIGILLILSAASLWGTAGIFVDLMRSAGLKEMQIVLSRALFSAVILAAVIVIKDISLFKIKPRDIWIFACTGLFSIVMFNFCYYKTMALSTLSVAAVLLYTAPFFVVVMSSLFFGEKMTMQKLIACATAFIGCCFVSGLFSEGQMISGKCVVYGLLTGFGYSLYTVFSNILLKKGYDSLTITFYTFAFALLGCLFLVDIRETAGYIASSRGVIYSLLMALTNTVVPYILYTNGLKSVEPSKAPIIATVEPVVATLIGAAFFAQDITLSGAIGIILVIGSVAVLNIRFKKAGAKK